MPERFHWRLLWLAHAKFAVGVTGVIFDETERVLLFRHVFRNESPWGLPSGWLRRRESPSSALVREVREEAGVDVRPIAELAPKWGYALRVEVVVLAVVDSNDLAAAKPSLEIYECGLFGTQDLPQLRASHRSLIAEGVAFRSASQPAALAR